MFRKVVLVVLAAASCMISSTHAATIIWVSDNKTPAAGVPADQAWVDLLVAQGYTVDLNFRNQQGRTLDATKIAALNAADLIIISRDIDSGNYDDGQEPTQWNSITAPILVQIGHFARNNRWLWLNTDSTNDAQPAAMQVVDTGHPIFGGVTLDANKQISGILTTTTSFPSTTDVGNGTLIATRADNGQIWIAEWQPGQPYYATSTQTPAGHRMLFCSGGTVAPVTDGTYNLSPDGEKLFLNAIRYMLGGGRTKAYGPTPPNGALITDTFVTLGWSPGDFAVSHDLYLGESFEDVNGGAAAVFRGNQTSTSFFAGLSLPGDPYPAGLVPGTTYYWRVDEVNKADPNSPWKGDVWSFSVPPITAYKPNPADGAQSIALNASLSWTGGFGAKLHTVYFGERYDDVNNAASGGTVLGATTYNPGALKSAKVYYWRVDESNPPNTYKGQVWSFTTVGAVGSPYPSNGNANVEMNAILTWKAGTAAASHQLYFGTDKEAVRKAGTTSPEYKGVKALGAESYDPGLLPSGTKYYWRVDEVNTVNANSPWTGPLWSFTTGNYLLVDDFESYNDIDPPGAGSNRIFDKWIDGFGTTTNGALVGNNLPPYAERTTIHGGAQSMPFSYDNNLKFSEATKTLTSGRDWTAQGVTSLSLWFRGATSNAAEKMYVVLNGTAVVYNNDTTLTQKTAWTQWVIPLQQFTGVNLTNVTSITIGFGTKGVTTTAGGTGKVYFDDIRLVRP